MPLLNVPIYSVMYVTDALGYDGTGPHHILRATSVRYSPASQDVVGQSVPTVLPILCMRWHPQLQSGGFCEKSESSQRPRRIPTRHSMPTQFPTRTSSNGISHCSAHHLLRHMLVVSITVASPFLLHILSNHRISAFSPLPGVLKSIARSV